MIYPHNKFKELILEINTDLKIDDSFLGLILLQQVFLSVVFSTFLSFTAVPPN